MQLSQPQPSRAHASYGTLPVTTATSSSAAPRRLPPLRSISVPVRQTTRLVRYRRHGRQGLTVSQQSAKLAEEARRNYYHACFSSSHGALFTALTRAQQRATALPSSRSVSRARSPSVLRRAPQRHGNYATAAAAAATASRSGSVSKASRTVVAAHDYASAAATRTTAMPPSALKKPTATTSATLVARVDALLREVAAQPPRRRARSADDVALMLYKPGDGEYGDDVVPRTRAPPPPPSSSSHTTAAAATTTREEHDADARASREPVTPLSPPSTADKEDNNNNNKADDARGRTRRQPREVRTMQLRSSAADLLALRRMRDEVARSARRAPLSPTTIARAREALRLYEATKVRMPAGAYRRVQHGHGSGSGGNNNNNGSSSGGGHHRNKNKSNDENKDKGDEDDSDSDDSDDEEGGVVRVEGALWRVPRATPLVLCQRSSSNNNKDGDGGGGAMGRRRVQIRTDADVQRTCSAQQDDKGEEAATTAVAVAAHAHTRHRAQQQQHHRRHHHRSHHHRSNDDDEGDGDSANAAARRRLAVAHAMTTVTRASDRSTSGSGRADGGRAAAATTAARLRTSPLRTSAARASVTSVDSGGSGGGVGGGGSTTSTTTADEDDEDATATTSTTADDEDDDDEVDADDDSAEEEVLPWGTALIDLLYLSAPAAVSIGFTFLMTAVPLAFVGNYLGEAALTGASIGYFILSTTVLYPQIGMTFATDTLCSHAYGRDPLSDEMGLILQRGVLLNLLLLLPCCVVLYNLQSVLTAVYGSDTAHTASEFLAPAPLFLVPLVVFVAIGKFLTNQMQAQLPTIALTAGVIVTPWVQMALTPLGVRYTMLGMALVAWVQLAVVVVLTLFNEDTRATLGALRLREALQLDDVRAYMRLAIPSAIFVAAEASSFDVTMLVNARGGSAEGAAWSSMLNVLFVFASLAGGLSASACANIGRCVGANAPACARRFVLLAIVTAVTVGLVNSAVLVLCFDFFMSLFGVRGATLHIARRVRVLLPFFHVADCVQFTFQGIFSALSANHLGAAILLASLWGVGVPLALLLGTYARWHTYGVCLGMMVGLCIEAPAMVVAALRIDYQAVCDKHMADEEDEEDEEEEEDEEDEDEEEEEYVYDAKYMEDVLRRSGIDTHVVHSAARSGSSAMRMQHYEQLLPPRHRRQRRRGNGGDTAAHTAVRVDDA